MSLMLWSSVNDERKSAEMEVNDVFVRRDMVSGMKVV